MSIRQSVDREHFDTSIPPTYNLFMRIYTPPAILDVVTVLSRSGYETVLVGGAVRDSLLGQTPKDYDLATAATPDEVSALFPQTRATTRYGTALVPVGHGGQTEIVEVTTFRIDGNYSDGRRPDAVRLVRSLHEDLARRDFTVNSMAYDPIRDMLIDPFGGQADLSARVIRAVGDPIARFTEDYLRMIRAARFAARLGARIEPATAAAIRSRASHLHDLASERLGAEFLGLFGSSGAPSGVEALVSTGMWIVVAPAGCGDVSARVATDVAGRLMTHSALIRLAGLLIAGMTDHGAIRLIRPTLIGWNLGEDTADEVTHLARLYFALIDPPASEADLARLVGPHAPERILSAIAVSTAIDTARDGGRRTRALAHVDARCSALFRSDLPLRLGDLRVNGDDLLALGLRGRAIGEGLAALHAAVLERRLPNERDALLTAAAEIGR